MSVTYSKAIGYSYWRVWVNEDSVRVARDRYEGEGRGWQLQPEHLAEAPNGYLVWLEHEEGGRVPDIPLSAFTAYLDQGGR